MTISYSLRCVGHSAVWYALIVVDGLSGLSQLYIGFAQTKQNSLIIWIKGKCLLVPHERFLVMFFKLKSMSQIKHRGYVAGVEF